MQGEERALAAARQWIMEKGLSEEDYRVQLTACQACPPNCFRFCLSISHVELMQTLRWPCKIAACSTEKEHVCYGEIYRVYPEILVASCPWLI
jgi:hypothetical protein